MVTFPQVHNRLNKMKTEDYTVFFFSEQFLCQILHLLLKEQHHLTWHHGWVRSYFIQNAVSGGSSNHLIQGEVLADGSQYLSSSNWSILRFWIWLAERILLLRFQHYRMLHNLFQGSSSNLCTLDSQISHMKISHLQYEVNNLGGYLPYHHGKIAVTLQYLETFRVFRRVLSDY